MGNKHGSGTPKAASTSVKTTKKEKLTSKSSSPDLSNHSKILLIWCSRKFPKSLGKNVIREICSYLTEPNDLVLVEEGTVWLYNVKSEEWSQLWETKRQIGNYTASMAFIGMDTLFVCGGCQAAAYMVRKGQVTEVQSMSCARSGHGLIYDPSRSSLCVFGGYDNTSNLDLSTCEKYHLPSSSWSPIHPMNHSRTYFNPCSFLGLIYLCGGNDLTVETYHPSTDTCELITEIELPESFKGSCCTAVAYGPLLYILSNRHTVVFNAGKRTSKVEEHNYINLFSSCPPVCRLGNVYLMVGKTAKGISLLDHKIVLESPLGTSNLIDK